MIDRDLIIVILALEYYSYDDHAPYLIQDFE